MARKFNPDEIDESLIIAAVKKDRSAQLEATGQDAGQTSAEPELPKQTAQVIPEEPAEPPREETRRKRGKQDYESLFIKESTVTARLGKTVYIRKEFHDRILKIVQVIGGNQVSLFSYIDNVLAHHFESFKDDITEAYNQKNAGIF